MRSCCRWLLLQNLLSNALKFGRPGSNVVVTISCTVHPASGSRTDKPPAASVSPYSSCSGCLRPRCLPRFLTPACYRRHDSDGPRLEQSLALPAAKSVLSASSKRPLSDVGSTAAGSGFSRTGSRAKVAPVEALAGGHERMPCAAAAPEAKQTLPASSTPSEHLGIGERQLAGPDAVPPSTAGRRFGSLFRSSRSVQANASASASGTDTSSRSTGDTQRSTGSSGAPDGGAVSTERLGQALVTAGPATPTARAAARASRPPSLKARMTGRGRDSSETGTTAAELVFSISVGECLSERESNRCELATAAVGQADISHDGDVAEPSLSLSLRCHRF